MTQPTVTRAPRRWRFWSSPTVYPPAYTPRTHDRCEALATNRLTSSELIAMARAARAKQSDVTTQPLTAQPVRPPSVRDAG